MPVASGARFTLLALLLAAPAWAQTTDVRLAVVRDDAEAGGAVDVRLEMRRPASEAASATLTAFTADLAFDGSALAFVGRTSSDLSGAGYVLTARRAGASVRLGAHGTTVGRGRRRGVAIGPAFGGDVMTLRFRVVRAGERAPFRLGTVETSYFENAGNRPKGRTLDLPAAAFEDGGDEGLVVVTHTLHPGWSTVTAPVDARGGPPSSGAPFGAFLGDLWTEGFPGSDAPDGSPTVLTYDESAPGPFSSGYSAPPSMEAPVVPGQGVYLRVFGGDDPRSPEVRGGGTLTASVRPLREPFTWALSYTPTGPGGTATPADGWNLLGNPFAEAVHWGTAFTGSGVGQTVYVLDAETGRYLYYNRTLNIGTLPGGRIEPFQAFWAIAEGTGATLTAVPPEAASPDAAVALASLAAEPASGPAERAARALVGLRLAEAGGEAEAGRAYVVLGDGAADGTDSLDARHLDPPGGGPVLFSTAPDGTALAVQARPLDEAVTVPLHVWGAGPLTLTWPDLQGVPDAWSLRLVDAETGAETDLRVASSYSFSAGAEASERPPARLFLVVSAGGADAAPSFETAFRGLFPNPTAGAATLAFTLAGPAAVRAEVYDALGRRAAALDLGERGAGPHEARLDLSGLAAGVYVVRLVGAGEPVGARRLTVAR